MAEPEVAAQPAARRPRRQIRRAGRAFLFDPQATAEILADHADLAAVTSPCKEGRPADSFADARTSERQLYRILGNAHFDHLAELLAALDHCVGRGFHQPKLLRTRDRASFASALAELNVAQHFARLGAGIQGFDDAKGSDPVPDILVSHNGITIAVEVYAPFPLGNLEVFCDDLTSAVKNIDLPWDFRFELAVERLLDHDERGHLRQLHPWVLDAALSDRRGDELVATVLGALTERLDDPPSSFTFVEGAPDMNLKFLLALDEITPSDARLPRRWGATHPPGVMVPDPPSVFARLVSGAREKARRHQAFAADADHALLVVDLSRSGLGSELRDRDYRRRLLAAVEPHAPSSAKAAMPTAFVSWAGWSRPLIPWFLAEGRVPRGLLRLLDPDERLKETDTSSWLALID